MLNNIHAAAFAAVALAGIQPAGTRIDLSGAFYSRGRIRHYSEDDARARRNRIAKRRAKKGYK